MHAHITLATEEDLNAMVTIEKLAWGSPGENIEASKAKIADRIRWASTQTAVLAKVNGKPAGSQYCFRFNWDENVSALSSWDDYACEGWTEKMHEYTGHTGFLVGVGVIPSFRSIKCTHNLWWDGVYKISELLVGKTLAEQFDTGWVKQVIANARIPFYHKKPELSVEEYCSLRQEDGRLFDPVLRFHERMGAKIIKPVSFSMEDAESLNGGCWVIYKHQFKG